MCIPVFWSTLKELYETGRAKKVATFSQYVAEIEKQRTPEASKYWTDLLKGARMTPISHTQPRADDYVYQAAVLGPKRVCVGQSLPRNMTCANVVKAAWSLVLARHSGCSDVVFTDLVSGRAGVDPSVANALGCCSTPIPVRVHLDDPSSLSNTMTYADLVQSLQRQQLESMPYETFGFNRVVRECTDWAVGTPATSWINHVPSRVAGELDIGGLRYVLGQPATQEEKNWTFSEARISWSQDQEGDLEFHLVYAADRIEERVARRLYDDMVQTLVRILTVPHALLRERFCN
jgi:non-ribosomal peptide synthetase component F